MISKFKREGYLLIDHRESPGVPDAQMVAAGMPIGAGHGLYEGATYTCSHCCRIIIKNPQRTRERAYCAKCDKYICDQCGAAMAASGVCKPFKQIVEEVQEAASKLIV